VLLFQQVFDDDDDKCKPVLGFVEIVGYYSSAVSVYCVNTIILNFFGRHSWLVAMLDCQAKNMA
jgi:hypothetical protein